MRATQTELAERFRALHDGPGFVMPNAWDGLSAAIFVQAGFGFPFGEALELITGP